MDKNRNSYIIKMIHYKNKKDIYKKELIALQGLDDSLNRAKIIFEYLVDTALWQHEASYQCSLDGVPDYEYNWYLEVYDEDENLIDTIGV
jgi:hypothetical protein